jgi:hypothetical protein
MLGRLVLGIIKGIIVGGLVGFGLAKLGFVAPGAVIAYLAAAATGILVGLVAGKPIWAKDAKIEAGMKAFVGALLGAGLMFAVRRWLTFPVPFSLGPLAEANTSLGETVQNGSVGGLAITSLAAIAAVLGGFYEADNTPNEGEGKADVDAKSSNSSKRIAASAEDDEVEDDEVATDKKHAKK